MKILLLILFVTTINAREVSFEKDVAPILKNRCAKCHNSNGITDITDKDIAIEKRYVIKEKVESRKMPYFGKMTEAERELILAWIAQLEK
jgi:uncharacterized membrane protein